MTHKPKPEPSERENGLMAAAHERWVERDPPVSVELECDEDGVHHINAPHSDHRGMTKRLGDTLGTRSPDFIAEQISALETGTRDRGKARGESSGAVNSALALISAIGPENELEAALAVQMAQNHSLTSDMLGRAATCERIEHAQIYANIAVKLQRTFTAQVEALARIRGKGQQTVRVEHVTVEAGAQAIVGDVYHQGGRGGAPVKPEGQSHAARKTGRRKALPSPNAIGEGVPIAGRVRQEEMQDARRDEPRRTSRKSECI